MSSARDRMVQVVGPALAFAQARAAGDDLRSIDFDVARRLWIERLSGQREDGTLSTLSATLTEGHAPSVQRVRQWRDNLATLIEELRTNPGTYDVNLIDYEEE